MRWISSDENNARRALTSALIGMCGIAVCIALLGRGLGPISAAEIGGVAAGYFVVVLGTILLLRIRGLIILWLLSLVQWVVLLLGILEDSRRSVVEAISRLPEPFVLWTIFALPLFVATSFLCYGLKRSAVLTRVLGAGFALWMALLTLSSVLATFAIDVGPNPRQNPVFQGLLISLVPVAPFVVAWLSVRELIRLRQ